MTVAAIVIPQFALRVGVLAQPALDGHPLILGPAPGERSMVYDATPEAQQSGVRSGQGLRDAVALCPEAVILAPHPIREAAAAERAVTGLECLSPTVEVDPEKPGIYFVDLTGLERRLGPPQRAAERLLATAPPLLRPRVGVAPSKFAAQVAAHRARPGGVLVIDPGDVAAALAPAPITLLPLGLATRRTLESLGIRTLGQFAALPGSAVAARFGGAGRQAWELAHGPDGAPVRARGHPQMVRASLTLSHPATSRDVLLLVIRRLVHRAFAQAPLHHRHVRQARLRAALEGGGSWEQVATLREPGGQKRVAEALRYRVQDLMLPGPVEALTLELTGLIDATSRQELLPGFSSRRLPHLAEVCRQLAQRFGTSGLYRVVEVEPWSDLPERQHLLIALDA